MRVSLYMYVLYLFMYFRFISSIYALDKRRIVIEQIVIVKKLTNYSISNLTEDFHFMH